MGHSEPKKKLPSRDEVEKALVDLAGGRMTREAADRWAAQWVLGDDKREAVADQVVWKALGRLFGAESKTGPNDYLHGIEDFQMWLEEFRASPPSRRHQGNA